MDNKAKIRIRSLEAPPSGINENITNGNMEKPKFHHRSQNRFSRLKERGHQCCIPCLRSHNPLPENANFFQRLRAGLLFPPQGNVAYCVQFVFICLQIWVVLFSLNRTDALLNGNLFSLLMLFIACVLGGYLISFIRVPSLLGMLIVGLMLRNVPVVKVIGEGIDFRWSAALRKMAQTVILTRAGLGLDPMKLRKLSWPILRLAFIPCLAEAITVGIVSHFLLGFPWRWSLMLGFILGALSPAVTVPALLNLQERRYGTAKGIPTMCLSAGGFDNAMCITGFSIFLGTIFSTGDMVVMVIQGPLGVLLGVIYGFVMGFILWYLPAKDCSNGLFYRSLLLFGSGMVALFGSSNIGLPGAGPLGCLTTATVAAYRWRKRRKPNELEEITNVVDLAFLIVQHLLFGLIGAAMNISDIQPSTVGLGIATLLIGLCARSAVSFMVTLGTDLNKKEQIFVSLAWLSKATLQAVIGGVARDKAMEPKEPDKEAVRLGFEILTISVLAIVICVPLGSACMALLGPKFLSKGEFNMESVPGENYEEEDTVQVTGYNTDNDATPSIADVLVENGQFKESLRHVNQVISFGENPVSTPNIEETISQSKLDTPVEEKETNNSVPEPSNSTRTDVNDILDKITSQNNSPNLSAKDVDFKDIDNKSQIKGNISEASIVSLISVESENGNIQKNEMHVSDEEISLSSVPKDEDKVMHSALGIHVTIIKVCTHKHSPLYQSN
ncbi:hypothetical protein ACJMK2_023114 [Sinanodonta woodiana]|uniref:Cation/H+ exchanger transmembrane domain-containing protein n=1 Tax=Sinanodonta woodiana TaxID=1069815 RepID=A0ABD3T409_SINWO